MQPATSNQAASKKPVFWIFILALIGLTLFIGITNYLRGDGSTDLYPEDAGRDEVRVKNLADLRTENEAKLHGYAWVDRAKGKVQIPIQEAMKLVMAEIGGKKPAAAYPIVGADAPVVPAPQPATPVPDVSGPLPSEAPKAEPTSAPALSAPVKAPVEAAPKSAKPSKASKP